MADSDIKKVIERITEIPTLPQVLVKLMNQIEDPNSSANILSKTMMNDQALATRVLKLVNSSFYALPRRVTSIRDAIVILGFATMRSLAISAAVIRGLDTKEFSHATFWKQSLACGLIAETIEKKSPAVAERGSAFTIGLLLGMGKILLEQNLPTQFTAILTAAKANHWSFETAEKDILHGSHTEIAYWLMSRWKLAESVQNAMLYQYEPLACPFGEYRPYAAIAYLSRYFYRVQGGVDETNFDELTLPDDQIWQILGVTAADFPPEHFDNCLSMADAFYTELA